MTPAAYAAYPQRRWLFLLGLAPFCVAFVLSGLLSDETQIWLGDLRVLVFWFLCVFFVVSAFCGLLVVHGHSVMYCILLLPLQFLSGPSLERHRPYPEKEKAPLAGLPDV